MSEKSREAEQHVFHNVCDSDGNVDYCATIVKEFSSLGCSGVGGSSVGRRWYWCFIMVLIISHMC